MAKRQRDPEFYRNVWCRIDSEGIGYYLICYESSAKFDCDPELKEAFVKAGNGIKAFEHLLKMRIRHEKQHYPREFDSEFPDTDTSDEDEPDAKKLKTETPREPFL